MACQVRISQEVGYIEEDRSSKSPGPFFLLGTLTGDSWGFLRGIHGDGW